MSSDSLKNFVESVSGDSHLAIEENLGDGFVRLRVAEAERRQAKHDIRSVEDIVVEMLRNSRDAHAHNIYLSITREGDLKYLTFLDDGDGIPAHLHKLIFEPRVTSKLETMVMDKWGVHGRGMALYSIKCNALSAKVASSGEGLGSALAVQVDLNNLSEKADQSTLPQIERDEEGEFQVVRGPHNVLRSVVEFALEHKDAVTVYYGSPTEIAARLYEDGRKYTDEDELLFCDDVDTLPVCARPSAANDAQELMEICSGIGLPISERTAHRIIAKEIPISRPPLLQAMPGKHVKPTQPDIYKDVRGLKIDKGDLQRMSDSMEPAFKQLAEKYYLSLSDRPKVRVTKDSITIKFPISKSL